ncbi:phosphotransferase [Jeotgalibacillus haloalkalitolerans]|uniref:phosphotransferase n=1 Tax=Jeotgalibacillus haloalkalitolerans TaxID=3104292 RepID=UPI002ACBDF4F|nr:phosphotransferase [Jeotgalibacillus sp. HH7-29]
MNPWEATHPVSQEKAKEKIERAFPHLQPVQVRPCGSGFDHTVYEVNGEFVFRFPRRQLGYEAMQFENRMLRSLVKLRFNGGFEYPRPVFYKESESEDYPYVGFSNIKGRVLTEKTDTDLLHQHAEELGAFLKNLHALPVDQVDADPDHLHRLSSKLRKKHFYEIAKESASVIPEPLYEKLKQYIEQLEEWENPAGTVPLHGDLHPKNMIVRDGRLVGIIDWGDAHIGHPAADLSIGFACMSKAVRAEFFEAYGDIDARTEELARFKAVFIMTVLVRYAANTNDEDVLRWGLAGLEKSLE